MKRFTSKSQKIGEYGESICAKWLKNNAFNIIERNFTRNIGEIDIVCKKKGTLHFIEVKSTHQKMNVSRESNTSKDQNVTRETNTNQNYNPADNVSREKLVKIQKTALRYLKEKNVSHETSYQIDVYIVYIDKENKKHLIERIQNVI